MKCVLAFSALLVLGTLVAGDVRGLEIQVGPRTLVVSSGGDHVTVHTDFQGWPESESLLEIAPEGGATTTVTIVDEFLDDCGFYVVRCNRQAAAAAVGEFQGKQTTAIVTLTVEGNRGVEVIAVRK